MKKIVLRTNVEDEKTKRKMLKSVAGVEGVDSVSVDMKENKLTVIGETDPVHLISKLRKFGLTELLSVGPAKEVSVGSAKGEKSHSVKSITAGAPQIRDPSNDKYRPYEYTVVTDEKDENPNACGIS